MNITVLFFGQIKDLVGCQTIELNVVPSTNIKSVLDDLAERYQLTEYLKHCAVAVNQRYVVDFNSVLQSGDELAIIPPVSGG